MLIDPDRHITLAEYTLYTEYERREGRIPLTYDAWAAQCDQSDQEREP